MPIVTVVMPAYNASKYIAKAIDSVIEQTIHDWELIIINDGSTDNTLSIIEQYASLDKRIKYESIENTGSAKIPRDRAISKAQSEWIAILDADDYYEPSFLEKSFRRQIETSADMVLPTMILTTDSGPRASTLPSKNFDLNQVLLGKDAVRLTIKKWQIPGCALIKRSVITELSNVGDQVYMNSDEYDTRKFFLNSERVAFSGAIYHYRVYKKSITHTVSIKKYDRLVTNDMLFSLIKKNYSFDDILIEETNNIVIKQLWRNIIYYIRNKKSFNTEEKIKIKYLLEKYYNKVDKTVPVNIKHQLYLCKIRLFLFFMSK